MVRNPHATEQEEGITHVESDSSKRAKIEARLSAFARKAKINSKGPLSVVLVVTRNAQGKKVPLQAEEFLTPQGGQVAGLGRAAVQTILNDYSISRILAEEGGRTSRGSIRRMREYIELLNGFADESLL